MDNSAHGAIFMTRDAVRIGVLYAARSIRSIRMP